MDQSRASERHQVLMLALRWDERALLLAWRIEETEGASGFGIQKGLLDAVAAWLPEGVCMCLLGDRFYGTACADRPLPVAGLGLPAAAEGQPAFVDRRRRRGPGRAVGPGHAPLDGS